MLTDYDVEDEHYERSKYYIQGKFAIGTKTGVVSDRKTDPVQQVFKSFYALSEEDRQRLWAMLKSADTCDACGCTVTDWGCSDACEGGIDGAERFHAGSRKTISLRPPVGTGDGVPYKEEGSL